MIKQYECNNDYEFNVFEVAGIVIYVIVHSVNSSTFRARSCP